MNARIREIAPGVTAERVAESTHIGYNPIAQTAEITFVGVEYLLDAESAAIEKFGTPPDVLRATLSDIAVRRFGENEVDPVTGASLDDVSGAGIALLIKRAYHLLLNERAAAEG